MSRSTAAGYGDAADALAVQYESIRFEDVHRDVLHLYPAAGARALDIGAGTGRDAAALAHRGLDVWAVEPTAELRAHGQRLHASVPVVWIDDALPELAVVRERDEERFDLILLTAVWMHLDEHQRIEAMENVAALLRRRGVLSLSLRHGPVPPGRRMFDVSAEATRLLAARFGMRPVACATRDDMLGRSDVRWSFLVLQRPA